MKEADVIESIISVSREAGWRREPGGWVPARTLRPPHPPPAPSCRDAAGCLSLVEINVNEFILKFHLEQSFFYWFDGWN